MLVSLHLNLYESCIKCELESALSLMFMYCELRRLINGNTHLQLPSDLPLTNDSFPLCMEMYDKGDNFL